MKRTIRAEIIVEVGDHTPLISLVDDVAEYFTDKGFKVALPHVYPENPLIIECPDKIINKALNRIA